MNDFFELLNLYPSPHNGQPVRLRPEGQDKFEVRFQRERGLQAADISYIFSFVSMGVFMEYAGLCARAAGHELDHKLKLPKESELRGSGSTSFAEMSVRRNVSEPDEELARTLRFRQTSRKKYKSGISTETESALIKMTEKHGMRLTKLPEDKTAQAIWLNQRAVFDDMFDPAVRAELDHWLRYTKKDKESNRDGLAYDCMELNGRVMRYVVHHPRLLRAPGISPFIKRYYLRTMADSSDIFYMLAPFHTGQQAFEVGRMIIRLWMEISRHEYYLHPFGTIMSNHDAHEDFLKLLGITDESRDNYLVFIFRAGTSDPPVRSLRIPYDRHLIME